MEVLGLAFPLRIRFGGSDWLAAKPNVVLPHRKPKQLKHRLFLELNRLPEPLGFSMISRMDYSQDN